MNRDAMTPDTTAAPVAVDQRRVSAAVSALAPNTRKAYGSAWSAWQRWALDQGRPVLPGTVADYLEARHAAGASPATIRLARAAVAKVHQVSGAADPTADGLVTDVLKRIGRDGRDRGRGQVAGIGWVAANGGDSLAGLRGGALLRVMSDGLLRISEASALQVSDVEATADGGTVTIRASKTDQQGDGAVRFLGVPTVAAVQRYLEAAGITSGPLFRRIRKGGRVTDAGLGADSIRAIVRQRAAAVDGIAGRIGGHSLRVGSARELAADGASLVELAADGASLVELQQAGGWRPWSVLIAPNHGHRGTAPPVAVSFTAGRCGGPPRPAPLDDGAWHSIGVRFERQRQPVIPVGIVRVIKPHRRLLFRHRQGMPRKGLFLPE